MLPFDFSTKAASGITLSNPTVVVDSVVAGTGVIGDMTIGTPTVADLVVSALGTGGVDATTYRLKAEADGSNGEHYEIFRDLPVAISSGRVT